VSQSAGVSVFFIDAQKFELCPSSQSETLALRARIRGYTGITEKKAQIKKLKQSNTQLFRV